MMKRIAIVIWLIIIPVEFGSLWLISFLRSYSGSSPLIVSNELQSTGDRLISLLFVRRDNLTEIVRGEIYPLAVVKGGRFYDGSVWWPKFEEPLLDHSTPLNSFRHFTVYDRGTPIGEFNVASIMEAQYQCNSVIVGTGEMGVPMSSIRFDPGDPHVSSSKSYEGGKGKVFDYSLTYFLAISGQPTKKKFDMADAYDDVSIANMKARLQHVAERHFAQYRVTWGKELERLPFEFESFRLFDLDKDGKPEIVGQFRMKIKKEVPYGNTAEKLEEIQQVSLMVWLSQPGFFGTEHELLVLKGDLEEGSWGRGYELVDVADLDDDGVGEIVLKVSGWEVTGFSIYKLRNGKLEQVFAGAGYGC